MLISPATIEAVKSRADLVSLIGEVVSLRRVGSHHLGLCPFHSEKTPSFHVNPQRGRWHCFGCREGGGAIDFVIRNEGLSFPEAVRALAERLGIDIEDGTPDVREAAERTRKEAFALYAINVMAERFYVGSLWGGDEVPLARGAAHAYEELDRRALFDRPDVPDGERTPVGEALKAFRVGYAPARWRGLTRFLEKQKMSLELAEKAGLLMREAKGGYHDRFRNRLMFSVVDHLGRVVGFSGRALPMPDPRYADEPNYREMVDEDGKGPAKYINTPETPIYTKGSVVFGLWQAKEAIRKAGEAILVEGNFDVVGLHARGILNVVAPLGTAFSEAQAKVLRRYTEHAAICFDGDTAGKKATYEARGPIRAAKLSARAVVLPPKEDPDSFTYRRGARLLLELVEQATGLREHLFRQCFAGVTELEQLKEGGKRALALLLEEPDPLVRSIEQGFVDELVSQIRVGGRAQTTLRGLDASLRMALQRQANREDPDALFDEEPDVPADPVGFAVVGAVLDVPSVVHRPEAAAVLSHLDGDLALAVAAAQELSADVVLEKMPDAMRPHVEVRLAAPVLTTEAAALQVIVANGGKLRKRSLEETEEAVRRDLAEAEKVGDEEAIGRLLVELTQLARTRVAIR